eukprot:12469687-Alexandrium_andersonii.AAC.1
MFNKIRRWRPRLQMLATAWSTVSSRKRPLRNTGGARIARESRPLIARTGRLLSLVSLVRKQ